MKGRSPAAPVTKILTASFGIVADQMIKHSSKQKTKRILGEKTGVDMTREYLDG